MLMKNDPLTEPPSERNSEGHATNLIGVNVKHLSLVFVSFARTKTSNICKVSNENIKRQICLPLAFVKLGTIRRSGIQAFHIERQSGTTPRRPPSFVRTSTGNPIIGAFDPTFIAAQDAHPSLKRALRLVTAKGSILQVSGSCCTPSCLRIDFRRVEVVRH